MVNSQARLFSSTDTKQSQTKSRYGLKIDRCGFFFPSLPLSPAPPCLTHSLFRLSVAKVGDVVIGVTPKALGGVVSDSQVVEPRQEDQQPDDDDGDGAVWVLQENNRVLRVRREEARLSCFKWVDSVSCLFIHLFR